MYFVIVNYKCGEGSCSANPKSSQHSEKNELGGGGEPGGGQMCRREVAEK